MGAKPMFFGRRKVGEFGGHGGVGADKNVKGCQAVAGSGCEYIRCAQVTSRTKLQNLRLARRVLNQPLINARGDDLLHEHVLPSVRVLVVNIAEAKKRRALYW